MRMLPQVGLRASLAILPMLLLPLCVAAQVKPQPGCTDAQKADPKTSAACAAAAPKSPANFPFPGEDADIPVGPGATANPAAPLPQTPSAAKAADAHPFPGDPDAPSPQAAKSATDAHPYPGEPDAAKQPADDGFSSSSSGSSSSGTNDAPDNADADPLKDAGSTGEATKSPTGKRRKLPKIDPQTPESREAEDLDVAQFYMETGNSVGAYERAKDAVSILPNDPYAQFALGEAARKMGKLDEAREHFSKVLTLDPNDKQVRLTRQALSELNAGQKPK